MKVRINTDGRASDMLKLLPGEQPRWQDCAFDLDPQPDGSADFCVVLWNAKPSDRFFCSPENTLFIAGEPREKKLYPQAFYRQFGHLVDSHADSGHPDLHLSALGLNWHVGRDLSTGLYRYGYDHLHNLACPPKQNRISVICSNAAKTEGQRHRLAFLAALKPHLGDRLVHFGRGFQPIDDKLDAILPYRYHLVLENCRAANYWTEKLADAYLGWAYPLYSGCPNLADYFPPQAFTPLDLNDPAGTAARLVRLLDEPVAQLPQAQMDGLMQARRLVLDTYNPFVWAAQWAKKLYRPATPQQLTLHSHRWFRPPPRGHLYRMRYFLNRSTV